MSSTWADARWPNGPALLLVVALLASLVASTAPGYALPGFWATLVGLAVVYACVYTCRAGRAHALIAPTWLAMSVVLASVGLLVMHRPPEKLFTAGPVYAVLERLAANSHLSRIELAPNEVGGALACVVPLSVVVTLTPRPAWMWALAILRAGFLVVALLLTQSRGAVLAVASVLVLGAWCRCGRRSRAWVVGGLALAGCMAWMLFGSGALQHGVFDEASGSPASSLHGRMELWRPGLAMLLDMPITGIGLNGFAVLLPQVDPTLGQLDPSVRQHAHDIYLQTALDLGLPGLVAILAIGWCAARTGIQSAQSGPATVRPVAIGLLLGLLAYALHGLVEVVGLSSMPGTIVWITMGLLIALRSANPGWLHDGSQSNALRRFPSRTWLRLVGVVVVGLLFAAPVALNGAWLALRRADTPVAAASPVLRADLDVAARMAWGPFRARVWAARAFAARDAGDLEGERKALELAALEAPWDPTLALRLAQLDLSRRS